MGKLSNHKCECRQNCGRFTPYAVKTDKRRGHVKGEPMALIPGHNRAAGGGLVIDATPLELDELKIRELRSITDEDAAKTLTDRLRFLETQYKRNFVERGFILYEVEERGLWKYIIDGDTCVPYTSFDRWVCGEASHSRADCFESLRAVKELRDVPREQLMNVPRKNIGILSQLSTKLRKNPEVIKAAQTGSRKEFIALIQAKHPDQHVEHETKITAHPTKSQAAMIGEAEQVIAWAYGAEGRESVFEILATFFLDGMCEKEGYREFTNRRAFETAKIRGEVTV